MECRIDAHTARAQFGQIMDRAVANNERFIVARRGEPSVVIMSIQDFSRLAAPAHDWLQSAWNHSKRKGAGKDDHGGDRRGDCGLPARKG